MAALCPGVQYGLSSQQNFSENKDLIFVKLTDSALRAIEEFIKNQNKFSCQSPTIKFLQNTGELSFPSLHHEGGSTSFRFSMSSTADMEGPAGSFECIQQIGSPRTGCLECLGSIPYKIRILANDDVYEATRNRMTEAEDKYKNKCTREIKPNERDIGRKVKVKQSSRTPIVPPLRREQPSSMRESLVKPSYQSPVPPVNKPINHHHQHSATTAPATTTTTNGLSNGLGINYVSSSSRPHHNNKPSLPDIARRPLRERLVHLLALRPFKKFEIHDRLIKEGLREKNSMTSILKQIADMKDNSYILKRSCWNDVKEDWPFYTESEKQTLKRRKPANLTPPGVNSDGGSSGSGQSPTSTHPGSPPQITSTNKRPGFYENGDGIPTKRQRVSHYKRPANDQPISTAYSGAGGGGGGGKSLIENSNNQRRPVTDSRDSSNMNPRSRESPNTTTPGTNMSSATATAAAALGNSNYFSNYFNNGPMVNGNSNGGEKRVAPASTLSEDDDDSNDEEEVSSAKSKKRAACDSYGQPLQQKTFNHNRGPSPISRTAPAASTTTDCLLGSTNNGYSNGTNRKSSTKDHRDKERKYSKVTSSTNNNNINNNNRVARVSPDSQTDNLPLPSSDLDKPPVSKSPSIKPDSQAEFPDYLTQYVTIENAEQRRRYKAEFNADYQEYRELHSAVERVSRRFAQLEESLRKEDKNSTKYKELKKQIVKEYNQKKEDMEHQQQKKRFQYLHDKLSHIKRLVQDYDQSLVPANDENAY